MAPGPLPRGVVLLLLAWGCDSVLLGPTLSEPGLLQPSACGSDCGFAKFLLADFPRARCLDGSPAGGFAHIVPGSSTVIVQLQGGGFCDDFTSCAARTADRTHGLGGSGGWGEECGDHDCSGILSHNCSDNPDFCNETKVLLRFCSGDHWRGSRLEPQRLCSDDGRCESFRFSGAHILDALLEQLQLEGVLRRGSRLLLAGRSSGGVGVLNHLDRLAESFDSRGISVRGLLLWSVDVNQPPLPAYSRDWFRSGHPHDQQDTQKKHDLYGQVPPRACLELGSEYAKQPWRCKPHEVVGRLRTPVFVATNVWSSLAMGDFVLNSSTCPYARSYGLAAREAYASITRLRTDHGLFVASCFAHTVPWNTTVASAACRGIGCSLQRTFSAWYYGDRSAPTSVVEGDCGSVPCNSLCESQRAENAGVGCPALHVAKRSQLQLQADDEVTVRSRAGPARSPVPRELSDGDLGAGGCTKLEADLRQNGFAVLRKAFTEGEISGALSGMNRILDYYANLLVNRSMISSNYSGLPLDERALAIFQDYPEAAPKFFRSELHWAPEFHDLFAHRVARRVATCILKTQTLVMYPVYMGRMNLPNLGQHTNSFHQDAVYTYEYFNLNASLETMQTFMTSKVNFWTPLKDVDANSGGLMVRRGFQNRIGSYKEVTRSLYGSLVSELVTQESELPDEEVLLLDDLKAGDLVVFLHHTPHRGTPNRADGRVRWSLDWRLQNGLFSTMRDEPGFLIQSDRGDQSKIVSRDRWRTVRPAPRWSERRQSRHPDAHDDPQGEETGPYLFRERGMELEGLQTATAPDVCVPDTASVAFGCDHYWPDHP